MVDSNPGLTAKLEEEAFRTALFHNFSDKPFTGYWNGKGRTFKPGDRKYMPKYLAEHYAKHLVNSVLIAQGKETSVSPKKPEQVPAFMELFNQAFILEDEDNGEQDKAENQSQLAEREHRSRTENTKETKAKSADTDEEFENIPGDDADEDEG